MGKDTWYKKGLKFQCTGCGHCCSKEPGYVWLSAAEVDAIANHLQIPKEEFMRRYTRSIFGRISLLENKITFDCVFLKENKCTIYSVRPKQCRTFPWWNENLESPQAWKETAARCEGIDHPEAPVVSFEFIETERKK
jgi:Fe-S-cluster containining protein